jgi:signal peptide peptidase SppA
MLAKRLRANLAAEQVLCLHPPKVEELMMLAEQAHLPGMSAEVQARFGVQADDPSRLHRIGSVAVLPITGLIQATSNYITRYFGGTSLELLEKDFRAALTDSQVKAIVLFCDSYGGSASQNDEVSKVIYAARGKKPILAFVRGGCCSAAYYLASAADSIVASSSSIIGSVGTIAIHSEYSQYLEELGVRSTVLTFGKNKGHGNMVEKLSPEARATLQKTVDDFGNMFVGAVARNRGVSASEIMNKFGQGQAFLAAEAKERGMVDRVGTWEQVLQELSAGPAPLPAIERENKTESANAAGASAAVSSVSPPARPAGQEVCNVDPRIKAMLFARGFIKADASDAEAQAALNAYFAALNQSAPATPEATIAALMAAPVQASAQTGNQAPAPQQATPTTTQTVVNPAPTQATTTAPDATTVERQRILDLQQGGAALGIDAAGIDQAVKSGISYEQAAGNWLKTRAQNHKPVTGQVNVTQEGEKAFAVDALNAMALKMGCAIKPEERNQHVERLQKAPLVFFAAESLRLAGVRMDQFADPLAIAEEAMKQPNMDKASMNVDASASPVMRPGDFPNLLSALVNKMLDEASERSEATWDMWCGRFRSELPDFKPAPIIGKSQTNQLDEVGDGEEFTQLKISEELLSFIQLARFGNFISLTPVTVANDDIDGFSEDAFSLEDAWQMTINRLALGILLGNVQMLDTYALFATEHANIITPTGAAPSAAQWEAMNLKYSAQTTLGNTGYQRGSLAVALVAPKHQVAAETTFMSLAAIGESKQAATDSNLNTYRSKKIRVAVEPELQRVSSDVWYGFADPTRRPTIKVGFMRGFGRTGKRERWYDPMRKTQNFSIEGRVAAAASQWRNGVRNPGS